MDCQECKSNPVTIHFTQIINGHKRQVNLCDSCANSQGYTMHSDEGYSLQDILMGLFNFDVSNFKNQHVQQNSENNMFKHVEQTRCTQCNTSFLEFQKTGKFGCANCYKAFTRRLDTILKRVHSGNIKHTGKIPNRIGIKYKAKRDLELLKAELADLVEREEFEQAAVLRDKIKAILKETDEKDGDRS